MEEYKLLPSEYWRDENQPYQFNHKYELDAVGIPTDGLAFIDEDTFYPGHDVDIEKLVEVIDQCRQETNKLPVLCWDKNYFKNIDLWKDGISKSVDPSMYVILEPTDIPCFLYQNQLELKHNKIPEKKYRFSYLSGTVRYHRLELAIRIKKYVTKDDVVVINNYGLENYSNTVPKGKKDNTAGVPWASDPSFVDFRTELGQQQQSINKHIVHPAYNAKIHVIGETGAPDQESLVSEKTWRPLLLGCLSLTWGPITNTKYLAKAGVELLDVDKIPDPVRKLDAIVDMLKYDSVDDIYQKNKSMIEHNRQLVSSEKFLKDQTETARCKIMERL